MSGGNVDSLANVTEEAVISIRDLDVYRGGLRALADVSLTVRSGIVTGLLGPSGSGKTTLMRAIVGVQIVKRGEVSVLGLPAGSVELRKRIAYVTQAPAVYGDLTVRENLSFFAGVLGVAENRIQHAITTVGLKSQTDQVVNTLSGGERSRASLAIAMLGDPEVLVLDEPTVGLDPVLRQDLWQTFHRLADEGRTVLVSTHVMDEADRCDELILMREGQIVASGSPRQLLERSQTDNLEQAFLTLAEAS